MELNLEQLDRALVLTEEEARGVTLSEVEWEGCREVTGFMMVACLLTPRPFRYDVLKATLLSILRPVRGMELKLLQGNRFLLNFQHELDRDKALAGRPWIFDRNLMLLSQLGLEDNPMSVDLSTSPFHVRIHGLSIRLMTQEVGMAIGNRLEKIVEVAYGRSSTYWGDQLRILVALSIRKPLQRQMQIRSPSGEELTVSFTYEKLPTFYYGCGVLGHIARDCIQRFGQGEEIRSEDDLPYGPWLREIRTGGNTTVTGDGSWGRGGGGWGLERGSVTVGSVGRRGASIFDAPAMAEMGRATVGGRMPPAAEGGDGLGEGRGDRGGEVGMVDTNVGRAGRIMEWTKAEGEAAGMGWGGGLAGWREMGPVGTESGLIPNSSWDVGDQGGSGEGVGPWADAGLKGPADTKQTGIEQIDSSVFSQRQERQIGNQGGNHGGEDSQQECALAGKAGSQNWSPPPGGGEGGLGGNGEEELRCGENFDRGRGKSISDSVVPLGGTYVFLCTSMEDLAKPVCQTYGWDGTVANGGLDVGRNAAEKFPDDSGCSAVD
ncbi:hypothetical protein Salat_1198200 [Sesamum alatum]|uniref:CCHC-type domain-containing protein n=1 Tax=Sesamum alatum TaxID=300844 RepID=A0AAE1YFC5_9LAMI|nr:hypothetical protein Salat_1198200 [Sesamum alatum]